MVISHYDDFMTYYYDHTATHSITTFDDFRLYVFRTNHYDNIAVHNTVTLYNY